MELSILPHHHAVLVTVQNRDEYAGALWKELSSSSPAHRYFDQTVLDIDTARAIISWTQSPYHGERTALVSFHTAGLPAQNAMLKVLEEPPAGTRFILVTTHAKNLIDTVLSRVRHVNARQQTTDDRQQIQQAAMFMQAAPSARMKLPCVVELLSRIDEEGRKDREKVKEFILSLVPVLQQAKTSPRYVQEVLQSASYASDPSASGKALLEYLSLLLPVIK